MQSLAEEMVTKGIDYTMVRCGVLGDAPDWDRASVEETEVFAGLMERCYGRASVALPRGARRAPRCQNLLFATSSADRYVWLDTVV